MSYLPCSKKDQLFTIQQKKNQLFTVMILAWNSHFSLRIPFQSFIERYQLLRKSWGSSKKRAWDKSNSHPAGKKGKFLQLMPLPSRKIVTAPIWYHTDQIITVFTILKILL